MVLSRWDAVDSLLLFQQIHDFMHRFLRIPLALFAGAVLTVSCETDFSLNGDYELQPVVFGLLDQTSGVHFVKITKAFLGDGDNLVYATIPDSSYFNQVAARVTEQKNGTLTGRFWELKDTVVSGKSTAGIFYAPEQKVYVFHASDLDASATYILEIDVEGGQRRVTGSTSLLSGFKLIGTTANNPSFRIAFAPNKVDDDRDYDSWRVSFNEALHAERYVFSYTFRWTETYTDLTTASFEVSRSNGDHLQTKPLVPGAGDVFFSGLDFYTWLATVIPLDPKVVRRKVEGIDLKIAVAHSELHQYMEVGKPVGGIAQIRPEFTNLTGGKGLFSSRLVYQKKGLQLNPASVKELCVGRYTKELLFCSDYVEHASAAYYCP